MRFKLYQLKRSIKRTLKFWALSSYKYILEKDSSLSKGLVILTKIYPFNRYFVLHKIDYTSNLKTYSSLGVDSNSHNYSYIDIDTQKQVKKPKILKMVGYAILENARVITGSEFVFKGGIAYKQDYDFPYKLKDVNYALFHGGIVNNSSYLLSWKLYHFSKTIDKAIYLSGSYTKNWYHWMIEILPKLIVLKRDLEDFNDFQILVSKDVIESANHKSALLCFVEENKIISLDKEQIYRVNALIYVDSPCIATPIKKTHILSSAKDCNFYYSLMKDFKNHLTAELLNSQYTKGSKRIYLYREQVSRKFNQKEVLNLLERFDFSSVDTGKLSLKQQAELFNDAEIIVGATGAAWTNLLFCSENTKAVIFWPDNLGIDSRFPNLANLSGVDLYSLEFKNPEKDWVTYMKSEKEAHVNIENLDQLLKRLTL